MNIHLSLTWICLYLTGRTYGDVLGPLFTKLAVLRTSDADLRKKVAKMSCQIDDYEILVEKLKVYSHDILKEQNSNSKPMPSNDINMDNHCKNLY